MEAFNLKTNNMIALDYYSRNKKQPGISWEEFRIRFNNTTSVTVGDTLTYDWRGGTMIIVLEVTNIDILCKVLSTSSTEYVPTCKLLNTEWYKIGGSTIGQFVPSDSKPLSLYQFATLNVEL